MKTNPDNRPPNRCVRCGRPISGHMSIGPVCRRVQIREMLAEIRATGYDGKVIKDGIQLLIAVDDNG